MTDVAELRSDVQRFKKDVSDQFGAIRADLKDLVQAMRELVRIDGDIKRVNDVVDRVGHEVDDHELRIRKIEQLVLLNESRVAGITRIHAAAFAIISSLATGVITYFLAV